MDATIPLSGMENINNSPIPKLIARMRPGNMNNAIQQIKALWEKINTGEEFVFSFVDQTLAAQYQNDQNLGKIVSLATLLAILIGSSGLHGVNFKKCLTLSPPEGTKANSEKYLKQLGAL